jgi:hypothetical protein
MQLAQWSNSFSFTCDSAVLGIVPRCTIHTSHATDGYQQIPLKQARWPKYKVDSSFTYTKTACRSSLCRISNEIMPPPPATCVSIGPSVIKTGRWGSYLSVCRSKYTQPLSYAFFAFYALCQFTPINLRTFIFGFCALWLSAFYYANPLFLMGMSFLMYVHSFSNAARA